MPATPRASAPPPPARHTVVHASVPARRLQTLATPRRAEQSLPEPPPTGGDARPHSQPKRASVSVVQPHKAPRRPAAASSAHIATSIDDGRLPAPAAAAPAADSGFPTMVSAAVEPASAVATSRVASSDQALPNADSVPPARLAGCIGSSGANGGATTSARAAPGMLGPRGPQGGSKGIQRAQYQEALSKLLASSTTALHKFEASGVALERAAEDAEKRYLNFGTQLKRSSSTALEVQAKLHEAVVVSEHTTHDMLDAVDAATHAIHSHRVAHEHLASLVEGETDPSRLSGEASALRDAMAECRRILRATDATFAAARTRFNDASTAVQTAVATARRERTR